MEKMVDTQLSNIYLLMYVHMYVSCYEVHWMVIHGVEVINSRCQSCFCTKSNVKPDAN